VERETGPQCGPEPPKPQGAAGKAGSGRGPNIDRRITPHKKMRPRSDAATDF